MELFFNMWDSLRFKLMSNPGQIFRLTVQEGSRGFTLNVEAYHEKVCMFPGAFNQVQVLETIAKQGQAFVVYKEGELCLYNKRLKIFLGSVEYIGTNQYGGPKLRINGKECNSMKAISRAVFGEVRPTDYVREFITPYYMEEKVAKEERLESEIVLEDFKLVETKRMMGKYYPVISYQGNDYSGVTKLKEALPQLEDESLLQRVFDHIGWNTSHQCRPRHIEIIEDFNIVQISDGLWEVNGSQYFHSKKKLQDHIRAQSPPGKGIGRETAKKMFEELERRQSRV